MTTPKNLFFSIAFLLSFLNHQAQTSNVILIIADDFGIDACNGYDLGTIKPTTPHLDSLKNSGIQFNNVWSTPVCTPTRASIMSGKYGSKSGVKTAPGNLDTAHISIFNELKNNNSNYSTAAIGKWHISKPINPLHPTWHGADHYMGILGATWTAYDDWDKTENGITNNSTDYATTYFTNDAINWIDNQTQPWLLWLAHIAPHTPLHVPPAYMHTQPTTNSQIKKYMAMVESLDYEVGRLMDSMTAFERANTTIIFIGDNGTPNNALQDYPSSRGKQTLYQGGVHVPMFVSGYGVNRIGEEENALINVIDIYATILEITGTDLPGGIYNSLSFNHLLSPGSVDATRQYNYTELDTNGQDISTQGYTIRNEEYKLIEYYDGQQEFFNLLDDTLELNNLILGSLTSAEQNIKLDLETEAIVRQTSWSCKDYIQNGDETGIDCGGTYCSPCLTNINDKLDSDKQISLFPNPASNKCVIVSNADNIDNIKIYNSLGEVIVSEKNVNNNSILIDVSNLDNNVFYIQVHLTNYTVTKRLIIAR